MTPYESTEQITLARHLDRLGVLWTHPPLAQHGLSAGAHARHMGARAGVPDVLIFTPPPARPAARGVAIELKRRVGGSTTPEQEQWLEQLEQVQWLCRVCKGAADAIRWLEWLGWRLP